VAQDASRGEVGACLFEGIDAKALRASQSKKREGFLARRPRVARRLHVFASSQAAIER
jgi:hypothetical protein